MTTPTDDHPLDETAIVGCLLGQAVGDAMGLPMENLSPQKIARRFPQLDRPHFFLGRGVGSDDTEHACMTAQAVLRSGGDPERFRSSLGWKLRWWLLGGPPGIGLATLKACLKLWLGFSPRSSGVFSAGNGPAMRAAILGVCNGPGDAAHATQISTQMTHTDPQAGVGALVISDMARRAAHARLDPNADWKAILTKVVARLERKLPDCDLTRNMATAVAAFGEGLSVADLAAKLGLANGVTGYMAHTVPIAVYAFCRHPHDYRAAIEGVIRCGGDTDTVAAITGALVGAHVGKDGIPEAWRKGFADQPRSLDWIERLGKELAKGTWRTAPQPNVPLTWMLIPFRNLFVFTVAVLHVFRRLF